jgi:heme/copper-type cytochrome/quinol oxidase subunit 2
MHLVRKCNGYRYLAILTCCLLLANSASATALFNVHLDIRDGVFTPSTIFVPVDTKIKITLRNSGSTAAEFESFALRKEKVLAPGAQSFIVIAPLKAGQYVFFDDFHIDMRQGVIVAR